MFIYSHGLCYSGRIRTADRLPPPRRRRRTWRSWRLCGARAGGRGAREGGRHGLQGGAWGAWGAWGGVKPREPPISHGFPWFPMVIPMVSHGYSHGFPWLFPWFPMVIPMVYHGLSWFPMVYHGFRRNIMGLLVPGPPFFLRDLVFLVLHVGHSMLECRQTWYVWIHN